jgi:hypothetical protein
LVFFEGPEASEPRRSGCLCFWAELAMNTKNMTTAVKAGSADGAGGDAFLTRLGLATALQVSVCTVDRMVANGDIPCIRVRGRVRFCLGDVVEALRKGNRKFGRHAGLETTGLQTTDHQDQGGAS